MVLCGRCIPLQLLTNQLMANPSLTISNNENHFLFLSTNKITQKNSHRLHIFTAKSSGCKQITQISLPKFFWGKGFYEISIKTRDFIFLSSYLHHNYTNKLLKKNNFKASSSAPSWLQTGP